VGKDSRDAARNFTLRVNGAQHTLQAFPETPLLYGPPAYSRRDEMMWENFGAACLIEHRAALAPNGRIRAWDREDWVTAPGNRPGYDRPGNVITGMLLGYEPDPFQPGPARQPVRAFQNRSNTVPSYFANGGNGSIGAARALGLEPGRRSRSNTAPFPQIPG
jgi:hypothetical protein